MPGTTPAWEIIGQREDFRPGPTGAFVPGIVVTFRTATGATGSVFVSHAEYSVERVRQAVATRAAAMDDVAALHG